MNFSATVQQVTLPEDLQWKMIFNTNEMNAAVLSDTDYAQITVASLKPWSGQVYISI
jgi:maltooligosyltrehalose trehalohydrolase